MSPNRTRSPFDPVAYPQIVDRFLKLTLSIRSAKVLRHVNTAYAHRVDALLMKNALLSPKVDATEQVVQVELYHSNAGSTILPPAKDISADIKRLLSFVRILDISERERGSHLKLYSERHSALKKQYEDLISELAPLFVGLETVRLNSSFSGGSLLPATKLFYSLKVLSWSSDSGVTSPPMCLPNSSSVHHLFIKMWTQWWWNCLWPPGGQNKDTPGPSVRYPPNVRTVTLAVESKVLEKLGCVSTGIVRSVVDARWLLERRDDFKFTVGVYETQKYMPDDVLERCWEQLSTSISALLGYEGATSDQIAAIMSRMVFTTYESLGTPEERKLIDMLCPDPKSPNSLPNSYRLKVKINNGLDNVLQDLETTFVNQTDAFTASGFVKLDPLQGNRGICFRNKNVDTFQWLSLPLNSDQAEILYNVGAPSPFGRGGELVFDESYRSAHQIMPPDFLLSGEVLTQGGVLQKIQLALGTRPLYATVSKLNIYATGGMFKPHRDTPLGENHLGTITLCLPSAFTGGELAVRHNGEEQVFDWSGAMETGDTMPWTFLFSDCEHEVLPVRSGMRVTVAYDVFVISGAEVVAAKTSLPPPGQQVNAALQKVLDNPDVLPEGGVLAFGLKHEYATVPNHCSEFADMLKGADRTWHQALLNSGLGHEFVAVYEDEDDMVRDDDEKIKHYKGRMFRASRDFHAFEGEAEFDGISIRPSEIITGDVHWVTEPTRWGIKQHYASYGNQPEASIIYASVGLYAYVGPPGERCGPKPEMFKEKRYDGY